MSLATLSLNVSVALTRVVTTALELDGPPELERKEETMNWKYCKTLGEEPATSAGELTLVKLTLYLPLMAMGQA
jgi:hypothetical protein